MPKDQIVSDAVAAISAGQAQVLIEAIGAAVDASALEQKASDGTLSQADVDAAVKAAVDPLNAQIASDAQALADSQAKAQAAIADIQSKLDAMTSKEASEESIVQGLQSSVAAMQSAVDALKAIVLPVSA